MNNAYGRQPLYRYKNEFRPTKFYSLNNNEESEEKGNDMNLKTVKKNNKISDNWSDEIDQMNKN